MATPMTTAELLQLREQNLAAQARQAEARVAREAYLEPYQQALRLARLEGATGYGARADALSQLAVAGRDWDQRIAPVFTSIYDGRESATAVAPAASAAASSLAPIFIDGAAGMDVAPPALSAPSAPTDLELGITGPITSGSVPPPGASTTVLPSAAAAGRPGYGAGAVGMPSVVASTRGLPVPMQCASGVCRPDIRSGNFYANAEQAGIARNYPIGTTEFDRYAAEANRQRMLAGGAAGLVRGEQADRARILQDLRVTPEYGEAYAVALQNAGGRRDVAQALTDQMFVGQDPTLTLGLTENNTAPLIDEASSQAAALAMATGDATLANRLTEAAAGVGYYGLAGGLPYGLAADQPAVAAPGAVLQLQNVPSSLSAPARAAAGGSIGELTRRDAGEQALQAASAANASAFARQLQTLATLERNSIESFEMREAIRARYRANGGGNLTDEQLFALAAQASGR